MTVSIHSPSPADLLLLLVIKIIQWREMSHAFRINILCHLTQLIRALNYGIDQTMNVHCFPSPSATYWSLIINRAKRKMKWRRISEKIFFGNLGKILPVVYANRVGGFIRINSVPPSIQVKPIVWILFVWIHFGGRSSHFFLSSSYHRTKCKMKMTRNSKNDEWIFFSIFRSNIVLLFFPRLRSWAIENSNIHVTEIWAFCLRNELVVIVAKWNRFQKMIRKNPFILPLFLVTKLVSCLSFLSPKNFISILARYDPYCSWSRSTCFK